MQLYVTCLRLKQSAINHNSRKILSDSHCVSAPGGVRRGVRVGVCASVCVREAFPRPRRHFGAVRMVWWPFPRCPTS
jgi:hypothetical protein